MARDNNEQINNIEMCMIIVCSSASKHPEQKKQEKKQTTEKTGKSQQIKL